MSAVPRPTLAVEHCRCMSLSPCGMTITMECNGTFLITPHLQTIFLSAFIDGAKVPGMFSAIPADTSISS